MSNTSLEVCKKCGGNIRRGAGRSEFLAHVPMTKWYHVNCPTGERWESPWATGPSSRNHNDQPRGGYDPAHGMTEAEFLGDVGDK
jgi:hypothetical protein